MVAGLGDMVASGEALGLIFKAIGTLITFSLTKMLAFNAAQKAMIAVETVLTALASKRAAARSVEAVAASAAKGDGYTAGVRTALTSAAIAAGGLVIAGMFGASAINDIGNDLSSRG